MYVGSSPASPPMRLVPLVVLATLLAAAPHAQTACSDGTDGLRLSISRAEVFADSVRVCFAMRGNPAETVGQVQYHVQYNLPALSLLWHPLIPEASPYVPAQGYHTDMAQCLMTPDCDDNFVVFVNRVGTMPALAFSPEPVEHLCPSFARTQGTGQMTGIRVLGLHAEQADGSPATVCPPADLPLYDVLLSSGETGAPTLEAVLVVAPNPSASDAEALVTLAAPADVRAQVVDVLGRRVGAVPEMRLAAGTHRLPLGDALPAGTYVVRATVTALGAPPLVLAERLTVAR